MEIQEIPVPKLTSDTDVLIAILTVGVCGSDIHYYLNGRIGSQVVEYPFAVGHECAGVVEAVGPAVTRVKPGDRMALDPAIACYACDQCGLGRPHTCRNLKFLGCPGQVSGCLSEYIVMPEKSCFPIRDNMSFEIAALVEPLTIGVYAVESSIPMEGARIGILGAGPIGLSVLHAALEMGAEKVYMTDIISERLKFAKDSGAHWVGNASTKDVVREIGKLEPFQLDAVFECCGQQEALDQAIDLLKPGGKLMVIGIPSIARISFNIDLLRHKEICIQNVRRQNGCVQKTLEMIDRGVLAVEDMITHRFSFEDTQAAFDMVAEYRDGVIKAIIHLSDISQ